jgi:hypothetical protein
MLLCRFAEAFEMLDVLESCSNEILYEVNWAEYLYDHWLSY